MANRKLTYGVTGLVAAAVVGLAIWAIVDYSQGKKIFSEGLETGTPMAPLADGAPQGVSSHSAGGNAQPSESLQSRKSAGQSAYTETHLGSGELLPKGGLGASWAAVNPSAMGDLKGQNFLDAGHHTNTAIAGVSQTNRNASWDIRSEHPNPQAKVGPFLNSTIEANPFKRGLDA
jgi:hypothetical protein